ncbi:MAG: tetratricopeptide repeat protein [Candidatus Omnitrophica bacterium]|nr:tetratricopeptide repeat protein [Candidatus Omnitrophota bacterium]
MAHLNIYKQRQRGGPLVLGSLLIYTLILTQAPVLAEEWAPVFSADTDASEEKTTQEDTLKQKISLDYKDADLNSVLRSLAWTYKLNIVTSPDVKGRVTISLRDITVKEALKAILTINGLVYSEQAEIIYIAPGDPKTVEMDSEVIFLKYLSASEAQNILRKPISTKGDMKINEVTNSLIITDFPGNIEKVKNLLEKVDVPPKQVLIEAKIVDITTTDLRAMGVAWDLDYAPGHGIFGRSAEYSERAKGTISMAEQSSGLSGGQFALNTLTLKGVTVTATIDALVKDGKANLLASPSIAVLNGQEARIVIGERYPYKERTQTTGGTTETTMFVDIGTSLRVTPQINEDGYITMRIHPEVSSLYASLDAGPRITTREADTTVRVKEGETLIIGGLIKHKDDRSNEKIPILGSIPIIGFLFSRRERDVEQKELAVFITPRILRSREEKEVLGKKKAEIEEVYVNLEKIAELSVVERIFEKAMALDKGYGIESKRKNKQFRKAQALSLYEHIVIEFPDSERAPEVMYLAGNIYYKDIKDYKKAKEVFARLISDYPDSPFAKKARNRHRKLTLPSKKTREARPIDLKILRE